MVAGVACNGGDGWKDEQGNTLNEKCAGSINSYASNTWTQGAK